MPTYRAAVVGLTGIGAKALDEDPSAPLAQPMPGSHVAAYAVRPDTEVAAVCDLDPARLDDFRSTWGARLPNARCYADGRAMLAEEQIDILSICTSDHQHADLVEQACAAGVRAIFCEKPIATTLEDAD